MKKSFQKIIQGYFSFREKYATGDHSIMQGLADHGQKPEAMVIACCDSRVDPSLILQSDPGDLFTVRNVANIVPPYEYDKGHHATGAALEFGICYLNVEHLIILGHSQCGGIEALLNDGELEYDDFVTRWVSLAGKNVSDQDVDTFAKQSLSRSYENCLSFPWIKARVMQKQLTIHRWFFDIKQGEVFVYSSEGDQYQALTPELLLSRTSS